MTNVSEAVPQPPEQMRARRSRLRILEAATALFAERGFADTTYQLIAARADVSVGLACRYFPTKEHLVVALYGMFADDLAAYARDMPKGSVAARFEATTRHKLALLGPHRGALGALVGRALDPGARAGVLGPNTTGIRAKVAGVFALVVLGAEDHDTDPDEAARLAGLLYGLHLLVVFAWIQDTSIDQANTSELLDVLRGLLETFGPLITNTRLPMIAKVTDLAARLLALPPLARGTSGRARAVLDVIFRRRRALESHAPNSDAAFALHLPRIEALIERGERIKLVLPAFPAKAPNTHKVLGKRPDMAERLAIESLAKLLDDITEVYPPGAELVLCSDGGVFADLVGVSDADVAKYRADLELMIRDVDPERIHIFGLEDAFAVKKPSAARAELEARYAMPVASLRERARTSPSQAAMIDGIHRFLTEDERARDPSLTRSAAQKVTRPNAYEVVRRSEAWGKLVAAAYPSAIRLSIHPQPEVSEKIGVHLAPTEDAWLTPWHGCAVLTDDGFVLMRRADAEARGASVVYEAGRPSHMSLVGGASCVS